MSPTYLPIFKPPISINLKHKRPKKRTIGRRELVDFPELELFEIEAKIDTGAYTSALHCTDIREERLDDGALVIRCRFMDESHPNYNGKAFEFREFALRDIKNSFGEVERRFVITTTLRIFNEEITTEFSLSNRGSLKFPILIGRKILRDRFLIDVKKKNLSFKEKRRMRRLVKKKSQ